MKTIAVMVCLVMFSGCASLQERIANHKAKKSTYVSYIAPEITAADAAVITKGMAQFLGGQMAFAKTTLKLEPLQHPFHALLRDHLRGMGFGVVETAIPNQDAVSLRYFVTPLESGVLVRMRYQDKDASQFYARSSTGLSVNSYAMRGAK